MTEQYYDLIRSVSGSGLTPISSVGGVPQGLPPIVTTLFASNITTTSATLEAAVDPEGEEAQAYFQWNGAGTDVITNDTPAISVTNNLNSTNIVSFVLTNLQPGTLYHFQAAADNITGTTFGNTLVFSTLASAAPPTVGFFPNSGYFPQCVTVVVTSSVASVYFTTDGTTPTTNSEAVVMSTNASGSYTGDIEWCNPSVDLSALQVAAFGTAPTPTVVMGAVSATNLVGFPNGTESAAGDVAYIPVVVDLESNGVLKSLQFRVEVTPNEPGTPPISSLTLQALTASDYISLAGPSPGNGPVTYSDLPPYTTSSNGLGLLVSASGANSGLDISKFGVAVMLRVQIPSSAAFGETYSLNVLFPSGTSDGIAQTVSLTAMPQQTLALTDPIALAGDSQPPNGYNNGEFGNGELDNSDANAVLYALVDIRRPYSDSDAFKAMDAFPETPVLIGDGFISYLDWQTVLYRSVGLDTNNWIRFWTNGALSHQRVSWTPGGPPIPLSDPTSHSPGKLSETPTPPGLVWFRQISIGAGSAGNGLPGSSYSLPVYAKVLPGYSVSGMAFRAMVTPNGSAPAVSQVQFNAAPGVQGPASSPGLSGSDIVLSWSVGELQPGSYREQLSGNRQFSSSTGERNRETPTACSLSSGGGAADLNTEYQMESFPGTLWVGTAAQQAPSVTSDEWKISFFGSTTNPLAADDVDADGDGMPNWMEYLAGTNPTNAASRFQFTSATFNSQGAQGVALNWLTAPGKTYILESQPALGEGNWSAIGTNSGDGNYYQLLITNYSGESRFYQILLQP